MKLKEAQLFYLVIQLIKSHWLRRGLVRDERLREVSVSSFFRAAYCFIKVHWSLNFCEIKRHIGFTKLSSYQSLTLFQRLVRDGKLSEVLVSSFSQAHNYAAVMAVDLVKLRAATVLIVKLSLLLPRGMITLYNMCAVPWGCSVPWGIS